MSNGFFRSLNVIQNFFLSIFDRKISRKHKSRRRLMRQMMQLRNKWRDMKTLFDDLVEKQN